jgi:hypothetical protein
LMWSIITTQESVRESEEHDCQILHCPKIKKRTMSNNGHTQENDTGSKTIQISYWPQETSAKERHWIWINHCHHHRHRHCLIIVVIVIVSLLLSSS